MGAGAATLPPASCRTGARTRTVGFVFWTGGWFTETDRTDFESQSNRLGTSGRIPSRTGAGP
jgi:hypothetical protein